MVYDILEEPALTPVTTPVAGSTVALVDNNDVPQNPPPLGSVNVIVPPIHTVVGPVMGAGNGDTVSTV